MIEELQGFNCFIDADVKNGFYGYVLDEESRDRLTVTTPMGNLRPKFMPEGLACASLKFMEAMNFCLDDLNDGLNNILIGGFSDKDLYQKMKIFLQRYKSEIST